MELKVHFLLYFYNLFIFSDLVAAYKCLVKEKEVLESSLKAINQSQSSHQSALLSQDDTASESEESKVLHFIV